MRKGTNVARPRPEEDIVIASDMRNVAGLKQDAINTKLSYETTSRRPCSV
jgi:hypothetical protein